MSSPKNILDSRNTYGTYFVLEAFKDTTTAELANISLEDGPEGERVNGGILIINDSIEEKVAPSRYLVKDFNFDFVWTGNHTNTTLSGGSLIITDTSGGEFLTFLKQDVIDVLGTSLENITFALKIFWNSDPRDTVNSLLYSEPLYFSISEIEHKITGNQHFYDCSVVPLYNAKGQYVNYTRVYGMTITHKDGELHEQMPKAEPSGGSIKPRGEEDADKTQSRTDRILKSKPMTTLKDVFEAFEVELNQSTKIHKGQYQEWQGIIRDDLIDRLKSPPEQKKDIPVVYSIHLDTAYEGYKIDNRNIPFEQPEQRQETGGVRVIPTQVGEHIDDVIDRIMEYSRQTGQDARGEKPKDYKICKTWQRVGDTVFYDITIRQHFLPVNPADGYNSGPGESDVDALTFYFKSANSEDELEGDDVMMFDGILSRSDGLEVVEDVIDTEPGRLAFGGEREGITAERSVDTSYFETGYSGSRAKVSNRKVLGTEYPRELSELIKSKYAIQNTQQSGINITIPGNPGILSDLFRTPSQVANQIHNNPQHYEFPEVYPMYAKIIVEHIGSETDSTPAANAFYHSNWMHIYKIESIFKNGAFYQRLSLLRTDGAI